MGTSGPLLGPSGFLMGTRGPLIGHTGFIRGLMFIL